jgi:exopolysaccharide transport family protein
MMKLSSLNMNPNDQRGSAYVERIDMLRKVRTVLRRWKLITIIPMVAVIAMYTLLRTVPSLYISTTEILAFDPQRQIEVEKRSSPFIDAFDNVAMNTQIEVIKSKSVALRAAKKLGLDKDSEFQRRTSPFQIFAERLGLPHQNLASRGTEQEDDPDAEKLDRAANAVLAKLQVERVPFSYILKISVTSEDPGKAQHLAESIADEYLANQREARQDALHRVATWLKGRVDDLQSHALETESSIQKLKAESGITDTGLNNISEQKIAELNTQLTTARGEVEERRARLDQANRYVAGHGQMDELPEVQASTVISSLRLKQAEVNQRMTELRTRLLDNNAEVVAMRAQLATINKAINDEAERIFGNMKIAYESSVRRQQSLEASLQKLTAARGNSAVYVKLQQLLRVADADRTLYENYLSQYNEMAQRRTLQDANERIIAPATLPEYPSSPRRILFCGLAGILGLGGGVLLALLREYFQTGLKTGTEIEQSFGCPVVGIIPFAQHRKFLHPTYNWSSNTVIGMPLSHFSEAVRTMRIGLELWSSAGSSKVILITSSLPGEGKSTVAMAFAASSAKSGQRTVVLDCDLRQRTISEVLGKEGPGMSELLRGTAKITDVMHVDPVTNTFFISGGSIALNPADLLMSQNMRDLVAQLRNDFDYVVIDAPPLLPVVDALPLATMADKILVIVEWSRTSRICVSEALKILRPETERIAGIVLNKVDPRELTHYGYNRGYAKYRRLSMSGEA